MTLTLKFDLLLKNFNLGHNFLIRRDRAFILYMCIACDKDLSHDTIIFDLVTLTLKFDLLLKNFNHGCYLMMVAARRASLSSDNSYLKAGQKSRSRSRGKKICFQQKGLATRNTHVKYESPISFGSKVIAKVKFFQK